VNSGVRQFAQLDAGLALTHQHIFVWGSPM